MENCKLVEDQLRHYIKTSTKQRVFFTIVIEISVDFPLITNFVQCEEFGRVYNSNLLAGIINVLNGEEFTIIWEMNYFVSVDYHYIFEITIFSVILLSVF